MTTMQERAAKVDLLPCPFCGGEAELDNLIDANDYFVHCIDCEVQQIANYKPHVAARRWNERKTADKPPDPTRAALEECVRAMERVQRFLNFGDGETFNVIGYVDEAIATARNALQGGGR